MQSWELHMCMHMRTYMIKSFGRLGHPQPCTTIIIDNTIIKSNINHTIQPKQTKAMSMHFHWSQQLEVAKAIGIQVEVMQGKLCWLQQKTSLSSTSERNEGNLLDASCQSCCTQKESCWLENGQTSSKGVPKPLNCQEHALGFKVMEVSHQQPDRGNGCAWLMMTDNWCKSSWLSFHVDQYQSTIWKFFYPPSNSVHM